MLPNVLSNLDLLEAKAQQEGGHGSSGILCGFGQDAVGQCGLLNLLLSDCPDFALKIGVFWNEQSGGAGVNAGLCVVQTGDKHLRGRKFDLNGVTANLHVTRLELTEIDSGDRLPVYDKQQFVTCQEIGKDRTLAIAFDNLVQRKADCLESLEPLNFIDDSRQRCIDGQAASRDQGGETVPLTGFGFPREYCEDKQAEDQPKYEYGKAASLAAVCAAFLYVGH